MDKKTIFIVIFMIVISLLSLYIIKPFLNPILLASIVAILTFPLFKKLNVKFIKNKKLCSFVLSLFIAAIIIASLFFYLNFLGNEVRNLFFGNENLTLFKCGGEEKLICKTWDQLTGIYNSPYLYKYFEETRKTLIAFIFQWTSSLLLAFPSIFFKFIIFFFILFYLYLEGEKIIQLIKKIIPFDNDQKERIIQRVSDIIHAIIFGQMIMGVGEMIISILGFYIAGIPFYLSLICGVLIFFFAFIPIIGPFIIWVPLVIINLLFGNVMASVIILITGLIVSSLDTFLKPLIVGSRININPLFILFGILGGIIAFGITGFFIGPIIIGLFFILLEFLPKPKKEEKGGDKDVKINVKEGNTGSGKKD